jgi:hypothetical protein
VQRANLLVIGPEGQVGYRSQSSAIKCSSRSSVMVIIIMNRPHSEYLPEKCVEFYVSNLTVHRYFSGTVLRKITVLILS